MKIYSITKKQIQITLGILILCVIGLIAVLYKPMTTAVSIEKNASISLNLMDKIAEIEKEEEQTKEPEQVQKPVDVVSEPVTQSTEKENVSFNDLTQSNQSIPAPKENNTNEDKLQKMYEDNTNDDDFFDDFFSDD